MFDESISLAPFKIFRNLEAFFCNGNFSVHNVNLVAKLLVIFPLLLIGHNYTVLHFGPTCGIIM